MKTGISMLLGLLIVVIASAEAQQPTALFLRGHALIPAPQKVELQSGDIAFDESWSYDASRISREHVAVRALLRDLNEFQRLDLKPAGPQSRNVLRLAVAAGAVRTGADAEIEKQAYRLRIAPGMIEITGNGDAGLFYGVQTLLQLLKTGPRGGLLLPAATIEDWPKLQLRFLHWDTKHHQDRIDTLKRYLDWAARFKVNMIGFELEDKFAYPTNPIIGAPGAFTAAELQEIVNYGLERFIQVVPVIQAPSHMSYVLKHPQFAHLKSDGNNYQICMCDEESYKLIFQMYDDVINATKGVGYLFVSTDEVYYAGICAKCGAYTPENRSLKWVEYVRRARDFAASRGRRILVWAEYPLLPEHVRMIPPDVIDGVVGEPEYFKTENELGMRQLAYVSTQGAEFLFPNHLSSSRNAGGDSGPAVGRLQSARKEISFGRVWQGNPIGVFGAAWDDSGLHNETFWLGWAVVAANGWKPGGAETAQTAADFMNIYYGPRVSEMIEVYRGLQGQARFFESSWDKVVSRVRGPGYGNSYGKGIGVVRFDETLPPPALPTMPGLDFAPVYVGAYARRVEDAARMAVENDQLIHRIYQNISKADRNVYNLEVLLSLAELTGHHNRLILGMKRIEEELNTARMESGKNRHEEAIGRLVGAYDLARNLIRERVATFQALQTVWEKSRYAKGREVNGRKFLHALDDTKDHWADRRPDLSYMIAPEESIRLDKWMESLSALIREYAKKNNVPPSALAAARLEN
ncbi:MAG: beta-N-acetylhexosaminidase [Blastocatellia bacterium]|nr:beta-N-acetylhexosaminidase [Blastocatellia bacterium]